MSPKMKINESVKNFVIIIKVILILKEIILTVGFVL